MSSKSRKAAEAMLKRTALPASSSPAAVYGVTDEQLQDMREVFDVFTRQRGVHSLDAKGMLMAMRALGFEPSQSEVREMIEHYLSTLSKDMGSGKARKGRKKSSGASKSSAAKTKNGGKGGQTHSQKGKQGKGDDGGEEGEEVGNRAESAESTTGRRRSSRRATQVARRGPGSRSVYVDDSDDDVRSLGDDENDDDDDDNDDNNDDAELDSDDSDAYQQPSDNDEEEDDSMSVDGEASDDDNDLDSEDSTQARIRLDDFMKIMAPQMSALYDDMEIDRVFQLFDTSGKGSIDIQDLRRISKELGIVMKDQELREMVEEADKDGDQRVSRGEFARIMRRIGLLS
ncbi:hypothetical protein BGZ73_002443 [Actinomortierella ambigua]|nr:hypothetical protein BGZ73_002443 [Actinomortierella ambigua]